MNHIRLLIEQEMSKLKARRRVAKIEEQLAAIVKEEVESAIEEVREESEDLASKLETLRKKFMNDAKSPVLEKGSARNNVAARPERRIPLEIVSELLDVPINELMLYFLNGHRIREGHENVEYRLGCVYFYGDAPKSMTEAFKPISEQPTLKNDNETVIAPSSKKKLGTAPTPSRAFQAMGAADKAGTKTDAYKDPVSGKWHVIKKDALNPTPEIENEADAPGYGQRKVDRTPVNPADEKRSGEDRRRHQTVALRMQDRNPKLTYVGHPGGKREKDPTSNLSLDISKEASHPTNELDASTYKSYLDKVSSQVGKQHADKAFKEPDDENYYNDPEHGAGRAADDFYDYNTNRERGYKRAAKSYANKTGKKYRGDYAPVSDIKLSSLMPEIDDQEPPKDFPQARRAYNNNKKSRGQKTLDRWFKDRKKTPKIDPKDQSSYDQNAGADHYQPDQ